MKVPSSFEYAYLREQQAALRLVELAGERLRGLCQDRSWLFDDRIKTEESVFAKLQMGTLASLGDMDDIYAATVVVPTGADIKPAVELLQGVYSDSELKVREREDPHTFRYDDTHIYATIGSTGPGVEPAVRHRRFEIQVRTGLQFSWWKATHQVLYKGDVKDWRLERVASQARGTLEMVDRVLANLPAAAELLESQPGDADARFSRIAGWLGRWEENLRPLDRKRFVDTVEDWLENTGIDLDQIEAALDAEAGEELIANTEITPAQAIQVLIAGEAGLGALLTGGRRIVVTEELVLAVPEFADIPLEQRVSLD